MFRQIHRDPKKSHFGTVIASKEPEYIHRLNFYAYPPTEEITLDQFEQWAIDRLRGLFHPPSPLLHTSSQTTIT